MRSAATLDSDSLQTLHRVRSIYTAEPSARGRRRHTSSARSLPRVGSKPDATRCAGTPVESVSHAVGATPVGRLA